MSDEFISKKAILGLLSGLCKLVETFPDGKHGFWYDVGIYDNPELLKGAE